MSKKKKVAIVGGGISGLTVAYYLQKEILSRNLDVDYKLYESSNRLGGKIQTDYTNGFVIEKGPDSFLARKLSASRLAKEVGLDQELINNDTGQSFILKGNELYPIPGGAIMGIPTKLAPFATTKLFSPMGKLRAAADLIMPKETLEAEDRSLGQFFRKRLGNEVVENLIEPLLSGIYAGDIDRLSLLSTFPQFHEVEQKHRSLILGMKKTTPAAPKSTTDAKPKGAFLSFKRGLQSLVDSIENHLDGDCVIKGVGLEKVTKEDQGYTLYFTDGRTEQFDLVVLTTPHYVTREVLKDFHFSEPLDEIPATSVATVAMAFPLEMIKGDLSGTGFVVTKNSNHSITACTWTHKKWENTAPEGYGLLRCYVGRFGDDQIVDESDETIVNLVLNDLKVTMGIDHKPEFYRITRWKRAMPQYTVGHKQRIDQFNRNLENELPGVYVAGAAYGGIGLPDCIDQGEAVVDKIMTSLANNKI